MADHKRRLAAILSADVVGYSRLMGDDEENLPYPSTFGPHDIAGIIGQAIGREVTYTPVSLDTVKQSIIEMGWGEWGGQIMSDYSKAYSEGWGDFVNDDVETITGNKPRSLEQFAKEVMAHAFQQEMA